MLIKFNFKALARIRWYEYLTRFVLGGVVTAIAGGLSAKFGPILGGIFLAFPAIFPASATLLEKHERERKQSAGIPFTIRGRLAAALDARGAILGAVGGLAFATIVWQFIPRGRVGVVLLLAVAGWFLCSSLLWYLRKHRPLAMRKSYRRQHN